MAVADKSPPGASTDVTQQIESLTDGDPDAKEWLYRRFAPTLYRRVRQRFGANRHLDAEELLHDLFVWCFQNNGRVLGTFIARNPIATRTEFRLEGYLWGLLSGLVANRQRARRRGTNLVALETIGEPPGGDSEASIVDRDALVRLLVCVRTGAVKAFLYFTLRFVEGLTPEEVARVTGWPLSKTYKQRVALQRAVKRCVESLGL